MKPDLPVPAFSGVPSFTAMAGINVANAFFPSQSASDFFLQTAKDSIYRLAHFKANWDGFGSAKPDSVAIQRSVRLLQILHRNVQTTGLPWSDPHVAASEDGNVTFEWWKGQLKLTLYVGPGSVDFIRVWGPNMESEMNDGVLQGDMFEWLWRWLHGQK
jgi:hypothetical protein